MLRADPGTALRMAQAAEARLRQTIPRPRIDDLRARFRAHDALRYGRLAHPAFLRVLADAGAALPDADAFALCQRYDDRRNGFVNYLAFCDALDGEEPAPVPALALTGVGKPRPPTAPPAGGPGGRRVRVQEKDEFHTFKVVARLKAFTLAHRVSIREFARGFDPHRQGKLTAPQFRRALDSAGYRVSDADFDALAARFGDDAGAVCWQQFADEMESVFTRKGLERTPRSAVETSSVKTFLHQSMKQKSDHPTVAGVRQRFRVWQSKTRTEILPFFKDIDKMKTGLVEPHHFRGALDRAGFTWSDDEMEVMLEYYGRDGLINYRDFMEEVRTHEEHRARFTDQYLDKLQSMVREKLLQRISGGHYELLKAFQTFDKDGSGFITYPEMHDTLRSFEMNLSMEETQALCLRYDQDGDGTIDYNEFVTYVLPPDYTATAAVQGDELPRNMMLVTTQPAEREVPKHAVDLGRVMKRIQAYTIERSIRLREFFRDNDRLRSGRVTRAQFRRSLGTIGFPLRDPEAEAIADRFVDPRMPTHVQWTRFADEVEAALGETRLEATPRIETAPASARTLYRAAEGRRTQGSRHEALKNLLERLNHGASTRRLDMLPFFREFDISSRELVNRPKFVIALKNMNLGISEDEMRLLYSVYRAAGPATSEFVKYMDFVRDVEASGAKSKIPKSVVDKLEATLMDRIQSRVRQGQGELRRAFALLARSGTGEITQEDLSDFVLSWGLKISDEEVAALMRRYDRDGDGIIDFREFVERVMPNPAQRVHKADGEEAPDSKHDKRLLTFHRQLNRPKAQVRVTSFPQLMARLKSETMLRNVRVNEFFADFDPLRSGQVTKTRFRRALDRCGFLVTDAEFQALCAAFQSPSRADHILWTKFAQKIDLVAGKQHLEKTPRDTIDSVSLLQLRQEAEKVAADVPDPELIPVLDRVKYWLRRHPVDPHKYFRDYDKHHTGHVFPFQFEAILRELRVQISEDDIKLLLDRYCELDPPQFRYLRFMDHVKLDNDKVFSDGYLDRLQSIITSKLEAKIAGGDFQLRRAFKYFDRDGSGQISQQELADGLRFFGLEVTDDEVHALMRRYDSDNNGTIDYAEFVERFFPQEYQAAYDAQEAGAQEANRPVHALIVSKAREQDMADLGEVIDKVQGECISRGIRISEFFRDHDRLRTGVVSPSVFERCIARAGLMLAEPELRALQAAFRSTKPTGSDGVAWATFVDVIESAEAPKRLEQTPRLRIHRPVLVTRPAGAQRVVAGQGSDLDRVLARLISHCKHRQVLPMTHFQDYDPVRTGRVSVPQFRRVLAFLALPVSDSDFGVLCREFAVGNDQINYLAFAHLFER